ncbi:hypothetical protein GCM10009037_12950 [Halarchaeum grantii]|uniref:PGF-CTERM archaeal protein-sorting signal domain-containing protein n=1 Tax=Halarchaeum grantii TaxID=1193105 RepID=A0A830EU92_9EURY|nr:PGF-CTERM sorting domain-containing protein [Halarchaeum grantii]GGL30640.1 hypothetical protein GCM10009037_12950 [Halarchaeum grantii]
MRPPHALALGSLLLVGVTAALLAGPAVAADPVEATNGTTYDHGTIIAVDVSTNESHVLRNADGAFVAEFAAENGTVLIDTGALRNGDYTLRNGDGATVFAFGVDGAPTTTTTTTANTTDDTDDGGETVALEDGATHDAGVTLTRDVAGEEYVLRTGDGAFVRQLAADGGTVAFDTGDLDGPYRLVDADGTVVASFTVDGVDETTTTTPTTTTADERAGSEADAPLDRTVDAEDGGVYWRGLTLRFDVEGDATLRTGDGAFVRQLAADDGHVTLETASLDVGDYRLTATDAAAFSVARQSLDATGSEGTLTVTSNRADYPLVLRSDALTTDELHALVPASAVRDGRVLVGDVGANATLDLDASALASGSYDLTAIAGDTGVRDDATVTLAASAPASGEANSTATAPGENGASETTTTSTTTSATTTTNATTTTDGTGGGTTVGDSPGFGLVAGVLALAGAALLARRDGD